jgi:CheY-like chemotaxis protein
MKNDILQGDSLTALVIDDDEFSREVLREMLAVDGMFSVQVATDGGSGLIALSNMMYTPDVLICDVYMPNMDGIELLSELARRRYPGGIILLSGINGQTLAAARTIAVHNGLNVLGAFSKPLSYERLLQAMASEMQGARRSAVSS